MCALVDYNRRHAVKTVLIEIMIHQFVVSVTIGQQLHSTFLLLFLLLFFVDFNVSHYLVQIAMHLHEPRIKLFDAYTLFFTLNFYFKLVAYTLI